MKKTNEQIDLWHYEKELYEQGYKYIGGTDEAGRGPLIGPVVAACCVLPRNFILEGLTESKKLSEKKREQSKNIPLHMELELYPQNGLMKSTSIKRVEKR